MAPDELHRKLDEIVRRVDALHEAIVGDLHGGKTGVVRRVAELETRVARLDAIVRWAVTALGSSIGAVMVAWAIFWGGPHGK